MQSVWDEILDKLIQLNQLPHNRIHLKPGQTPESAARDKLAEIKSGVATLTAEDFSGPNVFLRVVGPGTQRYYSGEWWFDGSLLDSLNRAYSRIYFKEPEKKRVLRDMLRELLAISKEWNEITEVWALELPSGQMLRGYWGPGTPQKLFANLPLTAHGNRLLVGKARQIYFPVKNPLWVKQYRNLAS
jgi:hypothetical protein